MIVRWLVFAAALAALLAVDWFIALAASTWQGGISVWAVMVFLAATLLGAALGWRWFLHAIQTGAFLWIVYRTYTNSGEVGWLGVALWLVVINLLVWAVWASRARLSL